MDKIDEVLDLKPPTDSASNNKLVSVGDVKQENIVSEENINGVSSDNKLELTKKSRKKVHICSMCNYQTICKSNLHRHKALHLPQEERQAANESQKNVYRCALCDYQTQYKSSLRRHEKVHLTPEERQIFACAQCDKKYMCNQRLQDHIKFNHIDSRMKESQRKVRCSICHYRARDMSNLRQHEAVHLAPEERELFGCAHCEKQYMTKRRLKVHLKTKHSGSRKKKSQKKVHICSRCNYQTIHKSNLDRHKAVHLSQEERQAANESQKNVYRCALCDYKTQYKSSIRRHEKVHLAPEERQIFACAQCDKKYMSNRRLQDHIKLNHIDSRMKESQKKVRCSICDYRARDMSNLKQHEAVHLAPEERELFGCAHCEKQYMTKRHLRDHLKTNHSDSRAKEFTKFQKKVYRCVTCGYQTPRRSNLHKHQQIHLAPDLRRMFACVWCDNKYASNHTLQNHIERNHIDSRAKELKKSLKKVHRCVTCGYQTPRRSNLHKHQQIHLAPDLRRRFACVWCDNKYTSNQTLQIHIKRYHIDSRNADCTSPTDEVILDSLKIEMDELTILNDTKSSECISATNEIKSGDFIKTEFDDVTPIVNRDMHNDFKNTEDLSVNKEVKLEDFIKMEPDDGT
ncbi:putative zinc finger protein 840 [Sitophilus oryzae]|uniref:Zinc finger protein 840 n=1 Tax=Sitophilus oryzae TaxID=7048 RepID=A0A6J2XN06_SITOR|nr:putative zinc finger protein 840 [Sitophilus oryzae]